jgi:predicted transport protein
VSDIQLFRVDSSGETTELPGRAAAVEKQLQHLIEAQMNTFLGVRFLATEYATGKTHKGRIDSLGIDENGCPVIVEYKRHSNENVINQGLFYLDWLLDHQAEFRWLVMEKLGKETAEHIEWSGTRLLCIAADFTRYDQHAVQLIQRNIELIRYKLFGEDLLLLELVNSVTVLSTGSSSEIIQSEASKKSTVGKDKSWQEQLSSAPTEIAALFEKTSSYLHSLGDDVQEKHLKLYVAFRRLKNFATVVVLPKRLMLYLKLDPDTVELVENFSRDVRSIGHWGTGNLELSLRTQNDLERAKPLIERSYQEN